VDEAAFARRSQPGTDERPLEASMAIETPAPATREIVEANAAVRMRLPFADTEDFDDARRGRIGSLSDPVIRATDGASCGTPTPTPSWTPSAPTRSIRASGVRASWRPSMASSR
jgi:alkyl sulfatase BDS1-like metallo-beta-lactamase superfamily hydrolase